MRVSFSGLLLGIVLVAISHGAPSDNSQVEVTVRRIQKRSAGKIISPNKAITLNILGDGHNYELSMKNPSYSIFTPNFRYVVSTNEGNKINFIDETPSGEALREIEEQIYIDQESDAAVSIKESQEGHKVTGVVNNLSLRPNPNAPDKHQIVEIKTAPSPGDDMKVTDYIDLHRNITFPKFSTRATTIAQPEVWIVFDYDNSQLFGNDRNKILDYLGVFFHAINNRYATISNPKIAFKISGVTIMSSRNSQPFLERNKVTDGSGSEIGQVLEAFSKWTYSNQASGPKFDMVALITGIDLQSKESSGSYSKGVAGLAYLSAACWKTGDRWYATSVTEDRGGYFDGVFSVAHELAHNLGSPHDGSKGAESCSWGDGYIMSYEGWGTKNKFYFSKCSIDRMNTYIASQQGSCVKSQQSSTTIPISSQNVGDRYDMKALCVKYTKQSAAVPESTKSASELCKNLSCRYPTPGKPAGWYSITTLNHPPGDNTPCGSGGRCVNGDCVTPSG